MAKFVNLLEKVRRVATMNVSLPDQMKAWVESQTATGKYSNASDYIRDLVRKDQERSVNIAQLQLLIDECRPQTTAGPSNDIFSFRNSHLYILPSFKLNRYLIDGLRCAPRILAGITCGSRCRCRLR
jgi:antitoxin ParD1/3/4